MQADKPGGEMPKNLLDELNQHLSQAYSRASDPEMGGLSPDQVMRLIYSKWGGEGGALKFNTDLSFAEFEKSQFFCRTRTLAQALLDAGGVGATKSKNLQRRFVTSVLPLVCDEESLAQIWEHNKVVNEQDLPPLHIARVVAQAAGVIRFYKSKFVVPKSKARMLEEKKAGELFCSLFIAFFRKFNLAYTYLYLPEVPSVQTCVTYSLYRLGVVAQKWHQMKELPAHILLPAVREDIQEEIGGREFWTTHDFLSCLLISPLLDWGLLEGRYEQVDKSYRALNAVRVTPLYKEFLRFSLDG